MGLSERRTVEFFITLLYLYGDLEYPFGKYRACFVSWAHGCLLLVCTRELGQPVCGYCRSDDFHRVISGSQGGFGCLVSS